MPVFTTQMIEEISQRMRRGERIQRDENFENIPGTRKRNIVFEFTEQEQNEYTACSESIVYFINNYCKSKREDGSVGNIVLRDYQEDIIHFYNNKFQIFLKSKQMGVTLIMALIFLHEMLFKNNFEILNISVRKLIGMELIEKIKQIYKNLPFFLKKGIISWNINSIQFDNNSRIKIQSNDFISIGYTPDVVHIDEFASFPNSSINTVLHNIFPVISALQNKKLIISSSPNGFNRFYDIIRDSEEGRLPFRIMRLPYFLIPNRDEEWKNYTIMMLGSEELFKREFELDFSNGSENTTISSRFREDDDDDDSQFEYGFED